MASSIFGARRVQNVQELMKQSLDSVPESFIHPDKDTRAISSLCDHAVAEVPTVDMKKLLSSSDKGSSEELERLHLSCQNWGIFQLVNHGVSSLLLQKLKHEIEEFFRLPLEDKTKFKMNPGESEGYGNFVRSGQNQFDWADRLFMTINPVSKRKPHLFPELPESLRETLETYTEELQKIAIHILRSIAIRLNIDMDLITYLFEEENAFQTMRMNYYPPCPQPDLVVGIYPHSDVSAITILHQINGVHGLQIKRDGVWLPVDILPDAFIVNVGDIMEILSNGSYRSIEHRVMVNTESERISLGMFFNPRLDAEVGPAASLISPKNPAVFQRIKIDEYAKGFFSRQINGKSYLDRMKIDPHPAVSKPREAV